jgi:hypothetical protein
MPVHFHLKTRDPQYNYYNISNKEEYLSINVRLNSILFRTQFTFIVTLIIKTVIIAAAKFWRPFAFDEMLRK